MKDSQEYIHRQLMELHGKEDLFSRLKRQVLLRKLTLRKPENGGEPDLIGGLLGEALGEIFNLRSTNIDLSSQLEKLQYVKDWDENEGYYR